jgi:predicted nucleic acid-binding protein
MKVLIDTNVILDVLCDRAEFVDASLKVWKLCEVGQLEGYISALSIPNIVYILRKELTPEKTQQLIQQITMIFTVVDLRSSDISSAARMYTSDYEDAIQMCQAARIKADHIITRNIRDFKGSKAVALTPSELLNRL